MLIRDTLAKTAASMAGVWFGNIIVRDYNKVYTPQTNNDMKAMIIGTICPVLLSTFFRKSIVNIPHLGGLACASMMISGIATNHFLQKEQIKEQREELKKTEKKCRDTQEKLNEVTREHEHIQRRVRYLDERVESIIEENRQIPTLYLGRIGELSRENRELQRTNQQLQRTNQQLQRTNQRNQPTQQNLIRLRLMAVYSEAERFAFNNGQMIDAPNYEGLPEIPLPLTNEQHSELINQNCMITHKSFNEICQPVALKTGNVYGLYEYADLKEAFRGQLQNPYSRERLTPDMLNGSNDAERVLFRVNRTFTPQATPQP